MLPLRARIKKHDAEVDSSENANPQPPHVQLPLPRVDVLSSPCDPRRRSRWSLVGPFHTPMPVIHSLALLLNHLRDTSRTRRIYPFVFTVGLISPHSYAYSRPYHAGWVNCRTSPPLRRFLQPPRELEPWIHGHGVGIRGPAAQRAFSTHPEASVAE